MKNKAFLLLLLVGFGCKTTPQFIFCPPAKFANCTVAKCTPKAGGGFACDCFLDDRYSATGYTSGCVAATETTAQSRYHPVESYQECTNAKTDTPVWAWCLGVSCTIDGSGKVSCDCTAIPSGVQPIPYIVTTNTFLPSACLANPTGQVWSSATPGDVAQITSFLQKQPGLQSLSAPTVVVNKP